MSYSIRSASVALLALIYMCAGCSRTPPDDPRRPVLENYASIVHATYEDTLAATRALDTAVDQLLANPSEEALAAARERWREARVPYSHSEAFRFYGGPVDAEGGPEPQMNGWPLDENHIDAVQTDTYNAAPGLNIIGDAKAFPEITPELVAAQNEAGGEKNIASGWHAIEFLLWGQDRNDPPTSAGQRSYTDFVAKGDPATDAAARRGQYLKATTTLLISDLEKLVAAWSPQPGATPNYRAKFVAGDVYTGLKRMLTGIAALAEIEMAGERMNVPLLSGDQEEEQSCFSDTTAADLRNNGAGIEIVYTGSYKRPNGETVSGPSLADFVKKADARVADEMTERLDRTREALAAIKDPFDREIQPDNKEGQQRVQAAIDSLRAEALSIGRAAQSLQVFLSDLEGLGD
ncbi:putative iron-regulated protein [Povalibacter uvarum]|uniref:Putative iron-regulated protein n=1 Tax=Povalibacter uvarum TaxID=732238 RepID=A0A841HSS9_9GAMM|nr:imelysin family protein [Povalibacter uvarum]MBB6095270.1 putative iron-regulated protein [Povalibacter uvarum]